MKKPKVESVDEFLARGGEIFHIEDGHAEGAKDMRFFRTKRNELRSPTLGATRREMAKGRMITSTPHKHHTKRFKRAGS